MRRSAWRRHHRLVIGYVAFFVVLVGLFGGARLHAYSASERNEEDAPVVDVAPSKDLFAFSTVHRIRLHVDDAAYERALEAYRTTGAKDFFPADAEIDGVRVLQVGVRLKGNASLHDLVLAHGRPEQMPLLVSFDEYVRYRTFGGHRSIALRTAQELTPTTVANEALSMRLIAAAGAPGSDVAYTTLQFDDGPVALRLVVEMHDAALVKEDFAHEGVLYKALSTGSFTYRGEDPLSYATSFRQLTRTHKQDLQPLIDLLRWVQQSDDATFAAGIATRVDLDSFATYLALQNLLLNHDDMAGKGQNYTLFFDLQDQRFTVVTWDMNAAFTDKATRRATDHGVIDGNRLKARILATPGFAGRYQRAFDALAARFYAGGEANHAIDEIAAVLSTVPSTVSGTRDVAHELDALRDVVRKRTAALAGR